MCGRIADHANLVKKVQHAGWIVCLNAKAPKEIGLLLPRVRQKTRPSGDHLSQKLTELAKSDQGDNWIIGEIAFAKSAKALQIRVSLCQKVEIG